MRADEGWAVIEQPLRERVLAELHARPFTPLASESRLIHFAFQVTPEQAERDRHGIVALARQFGAGKEPFNDRHLVLDGGQLHWERHGEFITYTILVERGAAAAWPPDIEAPGDLLVAVDLKLGASERDHGFLVDSDIVNGTARIASSFEPNDRGFVEIAVTNLGMSEANAGAAVQRILEIEDYRCFALLGLPVAESAAKAICEIEGELPAVMARMDAARSLEDNRELLDRLTAKTLRLEQNSAKTHFRFGATRAYAELVRLRLGALAEVELSGSTSMTGFFSRRFHPAVRYCTTVSDREEKLASKLTRAAQLLRTRVDIALESQNRDLLAAMGDRVRIQLRLQRTVEGLSIAAVAYYIVGLLNYLLKGAVSKWSGIDHDLLLALCVPAVVIAVAWTIARIHRHHTDATSST